MRADLRDVYTSTAFNNECLQVTRTYRCGNAIGSPTNVVKLDDSYTLVKDGSIIRRARPFRLTRPVPYLKQCVYGTGRDSQYRRSRCLQGLLGVRKQVCCSAGEYANYCAPLQAQADCVETSVICKNKAWNNECLMYERTFNCNTKVGEPLPTNVTYLNSSYTVIGDSQVSTCSSYETNPDCVLAGEVCVDLAVLEYRWARCSYKDCWKTEKQYVCPSGTPASDCADLLNRPECAETGTGVCVDALPSGTCTLMERTFSCVTKPASEITVADCGGQQFCVDRRVSTPATQLDTDFGKATGTMEALREAGTHTIFSLGKHRNVDRILSRTCCVFLERCAI